MIKKLLTIGLLFCASLFQAQTTVHSAGREVPNTFTNFNQFTKGIETGPVLFANLGTLPAGTNLVYISDGTSGSNPCTGSGTGTLAVFTNGAWNCAFGGGGGTGVAAFNIIAFTNQTLVTLATTFGSTALIPLCYDTNGIVIQGYDYTINNSTFVASFSFTDPQSGVCLVFGGFSNGGGGPPPGVFSITPSPLSFGAIVIGGISQPLTLTVANNSVSTVTSLVVGSILGTNATDFSEITNTCGSTLASGTSCFVTVQFKPTINGNETASITFTDSYGTGTQTVNLTGSGFSGATIQINPTTLNFPQTSVGQSSPVEISSVVLVSGSSVTFSSITLGTNTFSLTQNCGTLTSVSPSCAINITFSPTSASCPSPPCTLTDTVTIVDTAIGSPQTITLSGTAIAPSTPTLSSIAISPLLPTLGVGGTQQETCLLTYSDGSTRNCTSSGSGSGGATTAAGWNSAAPSIASISNNSGGNAGLITGLIPGTSTISANSGGEGSGTGGTQAVFVQAGSSGSGGGTPTFVQAPPIVSNFSGASVNVSFTFNTTAGNAILACDYDAGASAFTTPTDTQGNTYTSAGALTNHSQCFTATNIIGGADTVTFARTGGTGADAAILELNGVSNTGPIDGTIGQSTGTGTSWSSSTTTSNSNDFLVEWAFDLVSSTISEGAGFGYLRNYSFGNGQGFFGGKTLSSAGSKSCTASSNISVTWTLKCIALTGGSGSSSSTVTLTTPIFAATQAVGNTNVVTITWQDATSTITSVTDAAGNVYTQGTSCLEQASGLSSTIYYSQGILASSKNKITVTWNGTGAQGVVNVGAVEYQGLTAIDGSCTVGTGTSASPSVSVTPAHAANTLVGVFSSAGILTNTVGSGATQEYLSPGGSSSTQYQDTFSTSAVSISNTSTNNAYVVSVLPFLSKIASTTATVTGSSGLYSIDNPPPLGWYPFAVSNSIFNQQLPTPAGTGSTPRCYGAASDGLNPANCTAGDIIAKANLTGRGNCYSSNVNNINCGFFIIGKAGITADQNPGIYYPKSTDNWFTTTGGCNLYGPGPQVAFRAPANAKFAGSTSDQFLTIFDQTQSPAIWITMYGSNHGNTFTLGTSSCSSGPSCAQPIPPISACTAGRIGVDKDWNQGQNFTAVVGGFTDILGGSINSADGLGGEPLIRMNEFAGGALNHAVQITVPCVLTGASASTFPFPAAGNSALAQCATAANDEPLPGMAFFLDYTFPQLSDICSKVPLWQCGMIVAMSTYGGYVTQTQVFGGSPASSANGMNVPGTGGNEGPEACLYYNSGYCLGQIQLLANQGGATGPCGTDGSYVNGCIVHTDSIANAQFEAFIFQGIPVEQCQSTFTDNSSRTIGDITCHIHIMDQCKIKTMAGVAGGC